MRTYASAHTPTWGFTKSNRPQIVGFPYNRGPNKVPLIAEKSRHDSCLDELAREHAANIEILRVRLERFLAWLHQCQASLTVPTL